MLAATLKKKKFNWQMVDMKMSLGNWDPPVCEEIFLIFTTIV